MFSGNRGNYNDNDFTDADDIYGKTKADGEVNSESTLTLRCSMIGRKCIILQNYLSGYLKIKTKILVDIVELCSGITNVRMGKIIKKIIKEHYNLSGIYNISSIPISKFELLTKLSNVLI